MTLKEALTALEGYGTAQTRKIYQRHGVHGPQFGVSYANLKALKKQLKTDHALAQQLWDTGNHDARVLATMVADPKQAEAAWLQRWAAELDNYPVTDAFTGLVARTALARELAEAWTGADREWLGRAGWQLMAHLALKDDALPDVFFEAYLPQLTRRIHTAPNRVKDAMNSALIAIGLRNEALKKQALAAAEAIGPVDVDHGETSCKTPDAAAYIHKGWQRKQRQSA